MAGEGGWVWGSVAVDASLSPDPTSEDVRSMCTEQAASECDDEPPESIDAGGECAGCSKAPCLSAPGRLAPPPLSESSCLARQSEESTRHGGSHEGGSHEAIEETIETGSERSLHAAEEEGGGPSIRSLSDEKPHDP